MKFRTLIFAAALLAAPRVTIAGLPVTVLADASVDRESVMNQIRWMKDFAQAAQQLMALKEQIEQMDDFAADVIGDAGDIVEWVNGLSGPWGPELIIGSDAYNEYLRLQKQLEQLEHWKVTVDPKFKFDAAPAPDTHPTLDRLLARYEVGTKYLADCVNANDKPATELLDRIAKMNSKRYLRKAGRTTNAMLGHMMNQLGNVAAASAQSNMLAQAEAKDKVIREQADVEAERKAAELEKGKRDADFDRRVNEINEESMGGAKDLKSQLKPVKFKEPPSITGGA